MKDELLPPSYLSYDTQINPIICLPTNKHNASPVILTNRLSQCSEMANDKLLITEKPEQCVCVLCGIVNESLTIWRIQNTSQTRICP